MLQSIPIQQFAWKIPKCLKSHTHKQTFHVWHALISRLRLLHIQIHHPSCVLKLCACKRLCYCLPHSSELCSFLYVIFFFFLYFHLKMNYRNILRNHSGMWWQDEQLRALQTVFKPYEESFFLLVYAFCLGRLCGLWTYRQGFRNMVQKYSKTENIW